MNIPIFKCLLDEYKSMSPGQKTFFWIAMLGFAAFDISGLVRPFELNLLSFFGFTAMSFSGAAFVFMFIVDASRVGIYNRGMLFATVASNFVGLMMLWAFVIFTIIISQKFVGYQVQISPWLGLEAFLSVLFCCIYMPVRNYYLHKDEE